MFTSGKVHFDHCIDVIMTTIVSQITSLTIVYLTVYSDTNQRKHQSSASLAFVWGIHRGRWSPRTKGQLRGKCFHLMTSSWYICLIWEVNQEQIYFLTRPVVNIALNKSISNELDITIHVIASQLPGHCDAISTRLWRHQPNENRASETRGRRVKLVVFIVIYGFVMSCKKLNNVYTLVTNRFCSLSWALKRFVTRVHILFSMNSTEMNDTNAAYEIPKTITLMLIENEACVKFIQLQNTENVPWNLNF